MNLEQLNQGESAVIKRIDGEDSLKKRLQELGFISGRPIRVLKNAPLQDPMSFRIMDYELSLRRSEAKRVIIEPVYDPLIPDQLIYNGLLKRKNSKKAPSSSESGQLHIALVGNPNSGKTTLFNQLSNLNERVGNYSGVTIGSKVTHIRRNGYKIKLVDLPGSYSLTSCSSEEKYVRSYLLEQQPDIVINVLDCSNLERNLYLTTQLIDMNLKLVLALNMWDELQKKGDQFDFQTLSGMLGYPMVPTISSKNKGLDDLIEKSILFHELDESKRRLIDINYGSFIEPAIKKISRNIDSSHSQDSFKETHSRFRAIKILEKDSEEINYIAQLKGGQKILDEADVLRAKIENQHKQSFDTLITDAKYGFIEGALKETLIPGPEQKINFSRMIDGVLTSKILSYPIFLGLIWLVFQATFYLGSYPMAWIETAIAWTSLQLNQLLPDHWIRNLLVDGIIGGVGGVLVFLPNILILFFFLSLLETTGYMARVAFIVDKLMHKIGLHGRSFIPMLMGFGCNVPAIMATRTIESRNDRMVTMMIIPFMSCSARYPVYILIISAFFANHQGSILFGIYMLGILLAAMIAWLFKKTLFQKEEMPFVMELPPYRMPTLRSLFKYTWFKGSQYLKKMGSIILIASVLIWALGFFPMNHSLKADYEQKIAGLEHLSEKEKSTQAEAYEQVYHFKKQQASYMGRMGKAIEPLIEPLGFDWRLGVSIIAGAAAKEVVVSTMGVIFPADQKQQSLPQRLQQAATEDGVPLFTTATSLSFLVFILIYFPCIAVIAAIKKESGKWKYALLLAGYTTALAWVLSFITFQFVSLFS